VASYLFVMDLWLNRGHVMTLTRATSWSAMYVLIALAFAGYIWGARGPDDAQMFLTAYLLEKVLSVDNLMVFSAVFAYFGIRPDNRHRILRWGIIGAAAMRLGFVYAGTALFAAAEMWMSLGFAVLIAYAAYLILKGSADKEVDHNRRWYTRALRRWFPVYTGPGADSTFTIRCLRHHSYECAEHSWNRKWTEGETYWAITPALLCLVAIEMSDVMFAVDSVPVVIAVARDPFIVYSSMIFAIMGLRAMYFVLDALQRMLRYMDIAVATVLLFVANKLVAGAFGYHVSPTWSLGIVLGILGAGVVGSLVARKEAV
jgi:tellurite resistance protein TerC